MITVTTYSRDHDYRIDLTVGGTTPDALVLAGIEVRYPEVDVIYPLVYPNFTFRFLGEKDLYEQFGVIGYDTHPFTLTTAGGAVFKGYLAPEVFSMPNTGFDEYFSINGVSEIENLKNIPFDAGGYGDTVTLEQLINDIFGNHTGLSGSPSVTKVFSGDLGSVNSLNFINDDDEAENLFSILEWIGTIYTLKFILNFDNTLSIYSLAWLAGKGGNDYAAAVHYGIDETYGVGEQFDKATVIVSDYEQPDVPVDFSLKDLGPNGNIPMEARQGKRHSWSRVGEWYIYERYITYFKEGESPWRFPKYRDAGGGAFEEVNEYDESQLFPGGIPVLGAYPMAYRSYPKDNLGPDNVVQWVSPEKCLLIKNWDGGNWNYGHYLTVMEYVGSSFTTESDSFLFFTFDYGFTIFSGTPDKWLDGWHTGLFAGVDYEGTGSMDACAVPLAKHHSGLGIGSQLLLRFSVKYRGKYWDDGLKGWKDSPTWFQMMPNQPITMNTFGSIRDYPPPEGKPFYESVSGYWLGFKENSGVGELTVTVQVMPNPVSSYAVNTLSCWLKNFNIRLVQATSAEQALLTREDTTYTNTPTGKFEYPSLTVKLSSSNASHASRSKIWRAGKILDTLMYVLPTASGTYAVAEKPEYHILRMITQYISRIRSVDDILDIDSFEWTKSYHGHFLWCNSLEYHVTDDTVQCRYYYNDLHYSPL
ncbi:MAG: hypothetical protein LBP50_01785 [Tannerella sp.]|jgi:hypothetical protein|nr:hypothetical protein [Tannerella sp.]